MTLFKIFSPYKLVSLVCVLMLSPSVFSTEIPQVDTVRNLQHLLYRVSSNLVVYVAQHGDEEAYDKMFKDLDAGSKLIESDAAFNATDTLHVAWQSFSAGIQKEIKKSEFEQDPGWSFSIQVNQITREANKNIESVLPLEQHLNLNDYSNFSDAKVILQYMVLRYLSRSYTSSLRLDKTRGVLEEDLDVLAQSVTRRLNAASQTTEDQNKAHLKRAVKLWGFIEPRFVDFSNDLTPFIVKRMSGQIIDQLEFASNSNI